MALTVAVADRALWHSAAVVRDPLLPDGSYDAVVVEATAMGSGVVIELTIVAGDLRGEVVALQAPAGDRDPLDLMGLPATLTVSGGSPHLEIEG